jgi:hypothetical protein
LDKGFTDWDTGPPGGFNDIAEAAPFRDGFDRRQRTPARAAHRRWD